MPRWLKKLLIAFGGLLFLLVAAVQVVLWTDIPRKQVIKILEKQFGLRVNAAKLSTGWTGNTTLSDVDLSLPLAETAFLHADTLKVKHTNLLGLLLGNMQVERVEFDGLHLTVTQGADKRWNVSDALELMTRAGGGGGHATKPDSVGDGARQAAGGVPQIPELHINEGKITLVDIEKHQVDYSHFNVQGVPEGLLVWKLNASLGEYVKVEGRFAPGQGWNHELKFALRNAGQLLRPWTHTLIEPFNISGNWAGRETAAGIEGRIDLDPNSRVAQMVMGGAAQVKAGGGVTSIRPESLQFQWNNQPPAPVTLTGGEIRDEGTQVVLDALTASVSGGSARISGSANPQAKMAKIDAAWTNVSVSPGVRTQGALHVDYSTPWPDQAQVQAILDTSGTTATSSWDTRIRVEGAGRGPDAFAWTITAPNIKYSTSNRGYAIDELVVKLSQRGRILALDSARLGNTDQLRAQAQYDFSNGRWNASAGVKHLLVLAAAGIFADVSIEAAGDPDLIKITRLDLSSGVVNGSATGEYRPREPKPLSLNMRFAATPLNHQKPGEGNFDGMLWGWLGVHGTLDPMDFDLQGELQGSKVRLGRRVLGDLLVKLKGQANAQSAWLDSEELHLLQGDWDFKTRYSFSDDTVGVYAHVKNLSMKALDSLLSPPPEMQGVLAMSLSAQAPHHDFKQAMVAGDVSVTGFHKTVGKGTASEAVVSADSIDAQVLLQNGLLKLQNVKVVQEGRTSDATVEFNTNTGDELTVDFTPRKFTVGLPGLGSGLSLNGHAKVTMNTRTQALSGPVNLTTPLSLWGKPLGDLAVDSWFEDRILHIDRIHADILGGVFDASATFPFDTPLDTTVQASWTGIQLQKLAQFNPRASALGGALNGTVAVYRAKGPHPLEPLQIDVALRSDKARFNGLEIGDADLTAFAGDDLDEADAAHKRRKITRVILNQSKLNLGGGAVTLWARYTTPLNQPFVHTDLRFENLELNQLVHAAKPGEKQMPGKLAGQLTLFGPPTELKRMVGEGAVSIEEADLANVPVLSFLYDAMKLDLGDRTPSGHGNIRMSLEQNALHITKLYYFNKGPEARGTIDFADISLGGDSPVTGFISASARPLKSIKIPVIQDIEKILNVVGSDLTSVRLHGTISKLEYDIVPFSEVGGALRRLIGGDISNETKGSAGQ